MLKHGKFGVRIVIFALILSFLVIEVNYILTPKKYFDDPWPTTSTYKGFYRMKKDSVDVIYLGSSHAASGFNPQAAYNKYGIKSYNLGCEQQNLLVSYYWLKEALRYQDPKVVILDTYMLFEYNNGEALNSSESCTRMAMDAMKWSPVKWEAVEDICQYDSNQTFNSYLLKNIRFHTRWTDLEKQDFTFRIMEKHYELKGYVPLNDKDEDVEYRPCSEQDSDLCADMVPLMEEYLEKIRQLCREKDIELVLVKTPSVYWDVTEHNAVQNYADTNELEFIDFNLTDIYDACGFQFAEDMSDDGHCNIWGSEKLSEYIGGMLYNKYAVAGEKDSRQWEETELYYEKICADCRLKYITDLNEYIDAIDQERYTILVAAQGDMTFCADDNVKEEFSRIGLDLSSEVNDSYYAAVSEGKIVQNAGHDALEYKGSTGNQTERFEIVSRGYDAGGISSITIDGEEYALKENGINIVVYSNETMKIIDSAVYDGTLHR